MDTEIEKEFYILFDHYNKNNNDFENAIKKDYVVALCHMYLSLRNEIELPFIKEGHIFDWKEFETNLNLDFVNNALKRAASARK